MRTRTHAYVVGTVPQDQIAVFTYSLQQIIIRIIIYFLLVKCRVHARNHDPIFESLHNFSFLLIFIVFSASLIIYNIMRDSRFAIHHSQFKFTLQIVWAIEHKHMAASRMRQCTGDVRCVLSCPSEREGNERIIITSEIFARDYVLQKYEFIVTERVQIARAR